MNIVRPINQNSFIFKRTVISYRKCYKVKLKNQVFKLKDEMCYYGLTSYKVNIPVLYPIKIYNV